MSNRRLLSLICVALMLLVGMRLTIQIEPVDATETSSSLQPTLGQLLFFDQALSLTENQSCASCHDPENAFIDARETSAKRAVSVGDDGKSFGNRNTPSIAYASHTPGFSQDNEGYIGGFFMDGRATTLADQALEPFINPIEMALPNHDALATKVLANSSYVTLIKQILGDSYTGSHKEVLSVVKAALAEFQRGEFFSTFDSKYDRYVRGEESLTPKEERGRSLFFSQLANCSSCHLLNTANVTGNEVFTNYRYHNIGVPENPKARALAAASVEFPDLGLFQHPDINDAAEKGKFKVPSLRNVAVTAPYMHNGVFKNLKTAVHFYNQFIVNNQSTRTNPETNKPWRPPEIKDNISHELLRQGQPMDEQRLDAIVAFLKTLTDKRYEPLLQ